MNNEQLREEWKDNCRTDVRFGGWDIPYEGIVEDKALEWVISKIDLIRSEYEEQRKKELEEIANEIERKYKGLNASGFSSNCSRSLQGNYNLGVSDAISIIKSKINPED